MEYVDKKILAVTPVDGSKIIIVHTVLWTDDFLKVLVVLNKSEPKYSKPQGWGVPSGKVIRSADEPAGRTPLEQASLEVAHECNIERRDFGIHRVPVGIRFSRDGRIHLIFTGTIESFTDIPDLPIDPDGDILAGALMDPDRDIVTTSSGYAFRGDVFYRTHLKDIVAAKNNFPAEIVL